MALRSPSSPLPFLFPHRRSTQPLPPLSHPHYRPPVVALLSTIFSLQAHPKPHQQLFGRCRWTILDSASLHRSLLVRVVDSQSTPCSSHGDDGSTIPSEKEIARRRKISLGNKGRTAWNKGKRHSEELRLLIKKRTIEALSDPNVRKKLGYFSKHSEVTKRKMSNSRKLYWQKRLAPKKSMDNLYRTWANSIAEAAMEGSHEQGKLEWDSYERIEAILTYEHLQRVRENEIKKLSAETMNNTMLCTIIRHETCCTSGGKEKVQSRRKKTEAEVAEYALARTTELKEQLSKFHRQKKQLNSSGNHQKAVNMVQESESSESSCRRVSASRRHRKLKLGADDESFTEFIDSLLEINQKDLNRPALEVG